jgi:hypothetical protein
MKFTLILGIRYDEAKWNLETFSQDRRAFLLELIGKYKAFKGHYSDGMEHVEFPNGPPELEQLLRNECESRDYIYDIWTKVSYSEKDIKQARFLPFLIAGDEVDFDRYHNALNTYREVLCKYCGRTNDSNVPTPYLVYSRRMKKPRDLFYAMNGITIISASAFELLRGEIGPWVDFGQAQILDDDKRPVKTDHEYMWIRPTCEVGPFVNAKVKKVCRKCKQPTEIRRQYSHNTFEYECVLESFKNTEAPIVLAANWFGEISPKKTSNHSHYVFISADLHEQIRKLKLKGFVKADYIVHAADEPYDWDPFKDRVPSPEIVGSRRRTLARTLRTMRTYYFWKRLAKEAYSFVAIKLYGLKLRLVRRLFGSRLDRLRKKHVELPFADDNTEASCPVSMQDILEYLDYEAPGGTFTGEPDFDFDPKFIRTAKVKDAVYWIWKFVDGHGTESYVTVAIDADARSCLAYDDSFGLTPEQFIMADYFDIM